MEPMERAHNNQLSYPRVCSYSLTSLNITNPKAGPHIIQFSYIYTRTFEDLGACHNNNQLLVFSHDGYIGSKHGCGINGYTQSGTSSSTVYHLGACHNNTKKRKRVVSPLSLYFRYICIVRV